MYTLLTRLTRCQGPYNVRSSCAMRLFDSYWPRHAVHGTLTRTQLSQARSNDIGTLTVYQAWSACVVAIGPCRPP